MSHPENTDEHFYERADSFIHLANEHCDNTPRDEVSASFMYGLSRFNAWVSARGFESVEEMRQSRQEVVEYFVAEYKAMLEENLQDYIDNYSRYMPSPEV